MFRATREWLEVEGPGVPSPCAHGPVQGAHPRGSAARTRFQSTPCFILNKKLFFFFSWLPWHRSAGSSMLLLISSLKFSSSRSVGEQLTPLPFSRNSNDDARCIDLLNNKTTSLPHTFN